MAEITVTNENFESEVINSDIPVLIDFWAAWCGPCRMLAPTVAAFAEEHKEIKVGKINVDEQPELAERYGITNIPTLLVFKNGNVVNKSVGVVPKSSIVNLIF